LKRSGITRCPMKKRDVVGNVLGRPQIGRDNKPDGSRVGATKLGDYRATSGRANAGQLMALSGGNRHEGSKSRNSGSAKVQAVPTRHGVVGILYLAFGYQGAASEKFEFIRS
jgi:hypothetical protein